MAVARQHFHHRHRVQPGSEQFRVRSEGGQPVRHRERGDQTVQVVNIHNEQEKRRG